jgi:hypothetical protein
MSEKLVKSGVHIAGCGQKEPVNLYESQSGYAGRKCRTCGQVPNQRYELLSPTLSTDFPFGSSYYCKQHRPPFKQVTGGAYHQVLFGK